MRRPPFCFGRVIGALAISACGSPTALSGQVSPDPTLDYGMHGVGFTVMEVLDSTRAFRPLRDFRGELATETARPVQVSIWYPADVSAQAPRMRAGEFRLLTESEVDFDSARDSLDAGRIRSDFIAQAVGFGQDPAAAARVWDTMTPAVRDASHVPGRYPTVLYLTSAGVSNPLLPAYLASHGFVVASFPANGRMTEGTLEFTPNALTLDTDIDDAGFVYSLLRRLPYADTRRLAVASFSSGSLAALLWAMRDMQVNAIVAVEGWERYRRGADIISTSVHYEPHRVRVPFLMIERAADETSPQYAKVPDVVGALPYADITRVAFRDAAHVDFLSHATFGHTAHHGEIYEATLGIIRRFLQSSIGEDESEAQVAVPDDTDPIFTVERQLPVGPVPTEEELYRLAETDPTAAEAVYRNARRTVPGATLFRRHVLVRAARSAITAEDSVTIMRIVDDAYPDSSAAPRSRPEGADAEPEVAGPFRDRLPPTSAHPLGAPEIAEGDRGQVEPDHRPAEGLDQRPGLGRPPQQVPRRTAHQRPQAPRREAHQNDSVGHDRGSRLQQHVDREPQAHDECDAGKHEQESRKKGSHVVELEGSPDARHYPSVVTIVLMHQAISP